MSYFFIFFYAVQNFHVGQNCQVMRGSLVLCTSSDQKWQNEKRQFQVLLGTIDCPLVVYRSRAPEHSELRQEESKTDVNQNKLSAIPVAVFLLGSSHSDAQTVLIADRRSSHPIIDFFFFFAFQLLLPLQSPGTSVCTLSHSLTPSPALLRRRRSAAHLEELCRPEEPGDGDGVAGPVRHAAHHQRSASRQRSQ